jgi:hypothetical protein
MIILPDVVGLVLCERISFAPDTGRVSLVDVFQSLRFAEYPTPAQRFTVFSALYDGVGEGTLELAVTRVATEEAIYFYRRWITLPGRLLLANLEIKVTRCAFPAPGRYVFDLRFDKQDLTRRYLEVYQE